MAKTTRSGASYTVCVSSHPPTCGSMMVWALRDFLKAIDEAGIPDSADLVADHAHSTRHFTGLRVRHVFVIAEAVEADG